MGRYPEGVRDARIKCVSCNAPVTITVDGRYACVECGRPVLRRNGRKPRSDGGAVIERQDRGGGRRAATAERRTERATSRGLLPADSDLQPDLSFVFPTMDEEEGIGECIDCAVAATRELDMTAEVIVSDSSTDRTPEIASEKGAIVVQPDELGYGSAYTHAFEHARGDLIVMGDADTTYDFEELPKLVGKLQADDADIVMGSRLEGEIKPRAMPPLHKYVGNPLLTKFLNVFYGAGVSDAHSGFRVVTSEALEELELRSTGMEFASEMVMDAAAKGLQIEEVPITYHKREGEATLHSFRDGWRHVKFMLTNAPAYLFAVPGGIFGTIGTLMMALSFFDIQPGIITFGVHTMIAGSLLTIVGFQVGVLSIFSSIAADPIRKPQDPITRWIEDNFRLEHGASLGLLLFGIGAVYATVLVVQWISSGFTQRPVVPSDLVVFTLIVLGVEMIFTSFHLSALAENYC